MPHHRSTAAISVNRGLVPSAGPVLFDASRPVTSGEFARTMAGLATAKVCASLETGGLDPKLFRLPAGFQRSSCSSGTETFERQKLGVTSA